MKLPETEVSLTGRVRPRKMTEFQKVSHFAQNHIFYVKLYEEHHSEVKRIDFISFIVFFGSFWAKKRGRTTLNYHHGNAVAPSNLIFKQLIDKETNYNTVKFHQFISIAYRVTIVQSLLNADWLIMCVTSQNNY